jgi:hypothetical protein
MHADDDGHATPARTSFCARDGLGVDWICQSTPFHLSAKVTNAPELFS